jgi:hypothetical protein
MITVRSSWAARWVHVPAAPRIRLAEKSLQQVPFESAICCYGFIPMAGSDVLVRRQGTFGS